MRVFEKPAFFVLLIKETMFGIIPFMVLLIIIMTLFTNVIYVFNMSRQSISPLNNTSLYPDDSGYSFVNALIHIYLISLGEFQTDDYGNRGENQEHVIRFQFLLATFII